eukprot:JZ547877.1.p1 GENE.JZ547877.1~~JZ547877.1.p1  ORF type:complete len:237 (+),score=30.61 JZ547877.1:2-712(+)
MYTFGMDFLTVFRYVMRQRYIIRIEPHLVSLLREWDIGMLYLKRRWHRVTQFRCFCSSCVITLSAEAFRAKSQKDSVRYCRCSLKRPDPQCPCPSCEMLLDSWNKLLFMSQSLLWVHTRKKYILGPLPDNVVAFSPLGRMSEDQRGRVPPKNWTLYRCRTCKYVMFAKRDSAPSSDSGTALRRRDREKEGEIAHPDTYMRSTPRTFGPGQTMGMQAACPVPGTGASPRRTSRWPWW